MSSAIRQDLDQLARMQTKAALLGPLRVYEQFEQFEQFELAVDEDDVPNCDNFNLRGPKQLSFGSAR